MIREPSERTELLVDTHVHTRYSDGMAGIPRIERHCKNREIGLAITDHNEIRGSAEASERERVPLIPGIEVGTEEGLDLLTYFESPEVLEDFYRDAVEPFLRTRYMVRSWIRSERCLAVAREMGAFVSLAHPFALGRKSIAYQHGRRGKTFVRAVVDAVDAIELYNGGVHRRANLRASEYAAGAGKRLTVGSDSHRLGTIGSCGVYLRPAMKQSSAELFESLTSGDNMRFKTKRSAAAASLPLLGIIVLKHTHHFVRATPQRKGA
jgi:predicted metal-dependent phosphoesterase TrpH